MRGFSQRRITVAVLVVVALVVLLVEVYAHYYVYVNRLPLLTQERALTFSLYVNGTYTFSSSGARWLLVLQRQVPTASLNYAYLYIFKIEQNASLFTQSIDLVPFGLDPTSDRPAGSFMANIDATFYYGNYTLVRISYDLAQVGTYKADFGLRVKVYEETLLGFLQKGEFRIPVNTTMYYNPQ